MKTLFRISFILGTCMFLIACQQSTTPTASPVPSLTSNVTATITPGPSNIPTAAITPTDRPEYVPPTLFPTLDLTLVPEQLSKAFSIQTIEDVNGHRIKQITGWDYGFRQFPCDSYQWLDSNHLLLYPRVGQVESFTGAREDLASQPVVLNLEAATVWLPHTNGSTSAWNCDPVYWSTELGILITTGITSSPHGTYDDRNAVFTYTYDGQDVAYYWGNLLGISPSRTKILVDDDTIIDLKTNKIIDLAWYMNYDYERSPRLYWSSDETRIYRCCYYFADLTTSKSYYFVLSDLHRTNGKPAPSSMLPHAYGQWVRNDTYFLVEWSWVDDGDIRFLPMFSPSEKVYYEVRKMAGISEDWHCQQTIVSPDGKYVWMTGWGEKEAGSYLVNLFTFDAQYFPGREYLNIDWSPNSEFAWLYDSTTTNGAEQYSILSVADNVIRPLPVKSFTESEYWWHETDDVVVYRSEDGQELVFLNVAKMSSSKLPFILRAQLNYNNLVWRPDGEKIALVAKDGSIWQVDYPGLEHVEQLTPLFSNVSGVNWSPDGNFISFVSNSDIYIVDTEK